MEGLMGEIRHSLRLLVRSPGLAAVAIISLALGIGANTTIFSFVNALFLQPLPVRNAPELVSVFTADAKIPGALLSSYPNYRDYRDHNRSFASLLSYTSVAGNLTGHGDPLLFIYQIVSRNYFQTLGVTPLIGRGFSAEEDDQSGSRPVALISYALWQRQFAGRPGVIEESVEINGRPFQILGVLPAGFQGLNLLNPADVWLPMAMFREMFPNAVVAAQRRPLVFSVVGRLKADVSLPRAQAEMQSIGQQLEREYPQDNQGRRPRLVPLAEANMNPAARSILRNSSVVLTCVAGLVLLIACANVANLLLARASGRNREMAVRLALGAGRWRLVRQLLAESTVLALAGGGAGLLLARWGYRILWDLRPPMLRTAVVHIELDGRVLLFTLAVSLATGILFGLAPALRATNPDLAIDLKERAGQAVSGIGGRRSRSLLVATEVALCVVGMVGAGLFLRSLGNAERFDPGYDADHLATLSFNVATQKYSEERGRAYQRQVVERAAAVPGVVLAALARDTFMRVTFSRTVVLEGDAGGEAGRLALMSPVGPNYFRTTGIALLRGRDFSPLDNPEAPRVAVANEAAAARFWPGQDPVGRRVRFSGDSFSREVIGIARTANYLALGEPPQPLFYTSVLQDYNSDATLIVRTSGDPDVVLAQVRRAVQPLDAGIPLAGRGVRTTIRESLWAPRLSAGLLTVFGILGMLLASLGIYGLVSYSVTQRVREIGIRAALGARPADVHLLIVRQTLTVVTAGVVAGLVIALVASRAVQSLLLVTSARDALTFVLAPSILMLVAVLAAWFPALRATRIDPALALRDE